MLINPGTGPVAGATREQAERNMVAFVADLGLSVTYWRSRRGHGDGRWLFVVVLGKRRVDVEMPGAPLEVVRDGPVRFQPRLYVDGSSWLWPYALNIARATLTGQEG